MSPTPLSVSRIAIRRFLLHALDLAGETAYVQGGRASPSHVLNEIRRLECVQIDPVAVVERNQHLALAARLPGYAPALLERLMAQRRIFEYWANGASGIPMEDYPVFAGVRHRFRLSPAFAARFRRVVRRRLIVRLLHLEPGVRPTAALHRRLRRALEAFGAFHGAEEVEL